VSELPDPLYLAGMLIAVGLLPFMALMVSSFTKIVVVLGLLRQALGTQQVPPNMVLNGIAIIMSIFVMAPVLNETWKNLSAKSVPAQMGKKFEDLRAIGDAANAPVRRFLDKQVNERYRLLLMRSARHLWPPDMSASVDRNDMLILVPSFLVSELTAAFQIGFLLYLAFIVVDLVIANILLAMGMSMTSPTLISVPFKLLLFVALDGWGRLIESLLLSYRG